MNTQSTKIQVLVLPAQEDIATFKQGRKPLNILLREFDSSLEVDAYHDGHDAIEDLHIAVEELIVVGSKVTYNLVDSEADGDESTPHEVSYATPAQAEAFRLRIPRHPATQSALIWPGIPGPSGHLFHGHPAGQSERSDAGVALLVRVGWRRQFLRPFAH